MSKKDSKYIELIENELRWYYRIPSIVAIIGLIVSVGGLFTGESLFLIIGGLMCLIGLITQWVFGFNHFPWKTKK